MGINQIHGIKRLGFSIFSIVIFSLMVFAMFGLVLLDKCKFADILTPITMIIPMIAGIAFGYLGLQSYTDKAKIGKAPDVDKKENS